MFATAAFFQSAAIGFKERDIRVAIHAQGEIALRLVHLREGTHRLEGEPDSEA